MVEGKGNDGSDWGRGDFERMRLLPKFRFLRFLSRFIVHKRREWGKGRRGLFNGELLRVGANTKGQASTACLRSESLRSARALWGATLRFYLCFDFFSSPHFFRSLFFCSSRLVSAFVLFCFTRKKTFQLTNAKQISNKSAKFPLTNKFLADFSLLCVCES